MKTTKRTWIAGALVVLMGSAGVAQAHDWGGDRSMMRDGPRGANLERMFSEADGNGDGKVTQEEVDALAAARFAEADGDGDGLLSAQELQVFAEARRAAREAERRAARGAAMIERFDVDGDGLLSAEELSARGPADMFGRLLDRLDSDEDGALSETELQAARDRMEARRGYGGGWWRN